MVSQIYLGNGHCAWMLKMELIYLNEKLQIVQINNTFKINQYIIIYKNGFFSYLKEQNKSYNKIFDGIIK